MIKIENTQVYGWEAAIRGMRNPLNSWAKSDSMFYDYFDGTGQAVSIGQNDSKLMNNLSNAGPDHGKFLRMITVIADITAPLYWWKEFDTYKVGTVANSCSTMHKIDAKEFTMDDFSCEHLDKEGRKLLHQKISYLNRNREKFIEAKTKPLKEESKRAEIMKGFWWNMIQSLDSSYNQKRTVQINYQVGKAQRAGRRHHKLDEWHVYCDWLESLPYFKEVCIDGVH